MSGPRWGQIYEFKLEGAQAGRVLILSEDDYNEAARDAVIVPLYRRRGIRPNPFIIDVQKGWAAYCTRIQQTAQDSIGARVAACGAEPLVRVRLGVRVYLDLDRLVKKDPRPPVGDPRGEWWPHQGWVRYASEAQAGDDKMFGILSEDDWNCRPTTRYSAAVRLTSRSPRGGWRNRWEVPVRGGYAVAGHLHSLLHEDLHEKPPRAPRPTELTAEELAAIADRLLNLLKLR